MDSNFSVPVTVQLLGVAVLCILIGCLWPRLYPRPIPGIPYNTISARRILGDVPDIVGLVARTREQAEPLFAVTSRRLGTPIAQVLFPTFFRKPLLVLEDPREAEDIILRRNREFDKAPLFMDIMGTLLPHATISMYTTPEMKAQRRMWQDTMSTDFLRRTAGPSVHRATSNLIELWKLKGTAAYKDKLFDVHDDLANTALDAVWAVVTGASSGLIEYQTRDLLAAISGQAHKAAQPRGEFVKHFMKYMSDTMAWIPQTPVPKLATILEKLTPRYRRFRRMAETEISAAMRKAVDRFEKLGADVLEGMDDVDTCAMDLVLRRRLLAAKKMGQPLGDPTKDAAMIDEMLSFLIGAHDSTSISLSWFLKFMGTYPEAQRALRQELQAAFPGPGLPSSYEILDANIPYLDATVEESFRLAGTAKAGLRQALVDTEILGYPVPKGTEILMNFHLNRPPAPIDEERRSHSSQSAAARRDRGSLSASSGHELSYFEPRRWLRFDKKTGQSEFDPYVATSLPFGGGFRGCFGRKLAYLEFKITITLLILSFEYMDLPPELRGLEATETVFRAPDDVKVRLKVLR